MTTSMTQWTSPRGERADRRRRIDQRESLPRPGLTSLAHVLPSLLDAARQQQLPYEAFLLQALGAE